MGSYHGTGPDTEERKEQFPPGVHRVKLESYRRLDSGDWLVVLSNRHGEVAEFLPDDIRPYSREEKEEMKRRTGRYPDSWRYWRIAGAFDYPTASWWNTPREERQPHNFNVEQSLGEMRASGKEVWIKTTTYYDKKNRLRSQIESAKSLERHAEEVSLRDPGYEGSMIENEPEPTVSHTSTDSEVPF